MNEAEGDSTGRLLVVSQLVILTRLALRRDGHLPNIDRPELIDLNSKAKN